MMKFAVTLQLLALPGLALGQDDGELYLDRFNYYGTEQRSDGFTDYGPEDWGDIVCNERTKETLDACIAYPDKWHTGQAWEIEDNYCRWCPEDESTRCGVHHQSPINVRRGVALSGDEYENECIDGHWIKYEEGYCDQERLREMDAFTVERFALRIAQPIEVDEQTDEVSISCPGRTGNTHEVKGRFPRLDFPKGFSNLWFLSHIDFKVPSKYKMICVTWVV
jgi:hypothetical protein